MLNHRENTHNGITRPLHIQGWRHLDAVFLAALATQAPVLLVGPHGTAKTLLVERISETLALNFRHYNASLLNYDDLVGIPLPGEDNKSLHFISTPGAIWEAEFVFFDEISRCRPDLQNKLFPIIHERRVIGMNLDNLLYRWAAMNPPSPDDPDMDETGMEYYLGSEPLDPALTDRFPFVVPVPNWNQLSKDDRRELVSWRDWRDNTDDGEVMPPLQAMLEDCAALIRQVEEEYGDWLTDYVVCVMDLLVQAKLPQSPRRARMIAQSIAAVHAARLVLEGEDADLEISAETALLYGLPQNATEVPPTRVTIIAVHRQAWEIANRIDDDAWRQVLEEPDQIKRVILADDLDFENEDLTRLITQALASDASDARRVSLAVAMYFAYSETRSLTPAAWEPIVKLAARVLEPQLMTANVAPNGIDVTLWNEIKAWATNRYQQDGHAQIEINYVLSGFPELWQRHNWKEALQRFRDDLDLFNIKEIGS